MKTEAFILFATLLIGVSFRPGSSSSSSSSSSSGNYFLDPLRLLGVLEEETLERSVLSVAEVSLLRGFWNSSWPSIVSREIEANHLRSGSEQRTGVKRLNSVSPQCADDLLLVVVAMLRKESWAFKMVDASGKLPSGLWLGNLQWIGSYGECVVVSTNGSIPSTAKNGTAVKGSYCLAGIVGVKKGMTVNLGICIPRTCNSDDAKALLNILLIGFTNTIYASWAACTDDSTLPLDTGACVVIVILCIFGVFLLLGTCLDILSSWKAGRVVNEPTDDRSDRDDDPLIDDAGTDDRSEEVFVQSLGTEGGLHRFLMAFSIVANTKKILSTEGSSGNRSLQALHGIRFLSMTWVILGHTFLFSMTNTSNFLVYVSYLKRFTFQAVMNATVSVDTFFVLGGTLVSFLLLKELKASEGPRGVRWFKFFFHRFWRLTPLYMMVMAFYTTLFKYFGSGPYWYRTSNKNCLDYWWTNLLYINNIVRTDNTCMGWTWYLANDMQFFLLSPLFIVLLYKWVLLGCILISVFLLTSTITTGVLTQVGHFPPSSPGVPEDFSVQQKWFTEVYLTPWCRIGPYLIGLILGYILYRTNCKLNLPKRLVVLFWLLAAVCNLSVLYGLWNVSRGYYLISPINALYASLHRTAWGIGVSWVILACATGNGGFINDLLSMPIMIPLSRLTYAAYLVHPLVLYWYVQNQKVPLYVDDPTMVYLFIGSLAFSYVSAFVVSIVCEAPLINLEKAFIRDHKSLEQRT